jgi:serine/threonine protein kinase
MIDFHLMLRNIGNHPNIIQFYGYYMDQANFWLVLEFMTGGSLWALLHPKGTRLPQGKPLDYKRIVEIMSGISKGMDHLHYNKVIHNDLKSANILLDSSGNPKVCDFGLSQITTSDRSMTSKGGTFGWMAPEV